MKNNRHVKYNLEVVKERPLTFDEWVGLMQPNKREEYVETSAE